MLDRLRIAKGRREHRRPNPGLAEHPAIFHITHHKAGSQWILAILRRIARPRVVDPDWEQDYLRREPLSQGKIYPTAYLSRPQFEALELPEKWIRFIVIRDFRDAFVSAYWSLKLSHPEGLGARPDLREYLQKANLHDGLMALLPSWQSEADLVASWVGVEEGLIRYENLVEDDVGILVPLLYERLGIATSEEQAAKVVESARFEVMTKGRKRGSEDPTAHHRKGQPGDWRNYIVGPVAEAFKERYGQLLIDTGYARDLDW